MTINEKSEQPRILIVDDVAMNLDVLSELLQPEYKVMAATSGEKALEIAQAEPHPDLILLDIRMPGIDGYETCERLKANKPTENIPVIFVTAEMNTASEERGLNLGAVDYITKPFNLDLVRARVHNHLELKKHRDNLEVLVKERTAELEKQQAKLEKSEKLYRGLLESSPDTVIMLNNQGVIELTNSAIETTFGYAPEELIGYEIEMLIPARFLGGHKALRDQYLSNPYLRESFKVGDLVGKRKDGTEFPVDISLSHMQTENGIMVIADIRDISEKEQLQTQLQQAQKMEAMGQLTGGIAHDFNNMLSSIIGYTELSMMVMKENVDVSYGEVPEFISHVHSAGQRAKMLIAQMLAFSRTSDGGQATALALDILVKDVVNMLRPVLPSSIELNTQFAADITPITADPVQLHQLVTNLCINARDAMDGKGDLQIALKKVSVNNVCTACHQDISGEFVELSVSDTGTGIEQNVMEKLFDPFFTTKEVGKGTGMGLAMVHGIVHDFDGHIRVDTEIGRGTTFRIYFPPVLEGVTEADEDVSTGNSVSSGQGRHVLVVDDEESITAFLQALLDGTDYEVTVFNDSQKALEYFSTHNDSVDLVITDNTMPNLTGFEMSQAMLGMQPELPVIICTGYSEKLDEEVAESAGITAYLDKPFNISTLLNTIDKVLN